MITNPVNTVINYNYFCLNFNDNFIEKCWVDDPDLAQHLREKFHGLYQTRGTGVIPFFMCELSFHNQERLAKWINENYILFSHLTNQ